MSEVEIKRADHHFPPLRKAQIRSIDADNKTTFEESIGGLRVLSKLNGDAEVQATLEKGVVIERPFGLKEKIAGIDAMPGSDTSSRTYYLRPGDYLIIKRPRVLRGITVVTISHTGDSQPPSQKPSTKATAGDPRHIIERRMQLKPQEQ